METDYKKGIDVLTRADGTKQYKPFAIYGVQKLYLINSYGNYLLAQDGYIVKNSQGEALRLLEEAIELREKWEKDKRDWQIVATETIYID